MPDPADLSAGRGPLDAEAVGRGLGSHGSAWPPPEIVSTVESTNGAVASAARKGAPEGFVLVAEEQTSGRGRLDRNWSSPRGAGLTLSVLLRPVPPRGTWGWLPLLGGLATLDAVRTLSDVDAALKWPNDLLLGPGQAKAAGILAESGDGAVVLGIGLNVSTTADELPLGATSLLLEGVVLSRELLLVELVLALESRYIAWTGAGGDAEASALLGDYRVACATLGRAVVVQLPHAGVLRGIAEAIDPVGGLQVRTPDGTLSTVVAADVVHVRPGEQPPSSS